MVHIKHTILTYPDRSVLVLIYFLNILHHSDVHFLRPVWLVLCFIVLLKPLQFSLYISFNYIGFMDM